MVVASSHLHKWLIQLLESLKGETTTVTMDDLIESLSKSPNASQLSFNQPGKRPFLRSRLLKRAHVITRRRWSLGAKKLLNDVTDSYFMFLSNRIEKTLKLKQQKTVSKAIVEHCITIQ
jgi:histone H3/H4